MISKKHPILPIGRNLILSLVTLAVAGLFPVRVDAQCTIDMSGADQQVMDGFGFCTAWCPPVSDTQAQILYGTGSGQLGFSLLRCRMDDDGPYFHFVENEKVNAATAHSYGAKVMGTQWAVPTQFATNIGPDGAGQLIPSASAAYADYLKQTAEKIGLDYVSFQNEPDLARWTPSDILDFVKNHGPAVGKPIIMPESYRFDDAYSDPVLDDPAALQNFAILGGHVYGGWGPHPKAISKGKRVWMTEHFIVGKGPNEEKTIGDHNTAMEVAQEVSDCMDFQMSAYIWWWIAASSQDSFIQGTTVDKRGYMLGQFSKYIRPGSTRVGATYRPQPGVSVTAYRVNGGCTIVVLNQNMSPVNQQFDIRNGTASQLEGYQTSRSQNMADIGNFNVSGGSFTATLPPQSVTTFVQPTLPVIVQQPSSTGVFPGANTKFMVTATGTQMKYQWYFNGTTALAGATDPILKLTGAQASQAGSYSVVVTNGMGSVTSDAVNLGVTSLVWGPPVTLSGEADISTRGSLRYAYNNSGNDATVNGVFFTGVNSSSNWGSDVTLSGLNGSASSAFAGVSSAPWGNLPASYQTILEGGAFSWGRGLATVTLNNLEMGRQYQVQIWVNDSRVANRTETVAGANTVTLAFNSTQVQDGVGQYTIGSFTASASTQSFTIDGGTNTPQINAIQVRDVSDDGGIAWGSPVTISGAADISTLGMQWYAYNGSGSNTTVNGVTFTGVNSQTDWGDNVALSGFSTSSTSNFEGGKSPWSSQNSPWDQLLASYKTLVKGGAFSWGGGAATVTLKNLEAGQQYQVQIWVHDSRNTMRTETVAGANAVSLELNTLLAEDGLGQFSIGTFTASASTQSFTIDGGSGSPLINAVQVRNITGAQIAPTGLTATAVSNSQIHLSWSATPGATGYNIYRGTFSGGEEGSPINGGSPVTTPSYHDTGLSSSATYYYVVRAVRQDTISANSTEVSASLVRTLPVTSGLVLRMDASQIAGSADGAQLDTWTDTSGAANHAVRQSGSSTGYPKYIASGINGLPVVRFNSSDSELGDSLKFNRISNIQTVFWVLKENAGLSGRRFLLGDDTNYHFHRGDSNGSLWDSNYTHKRITDGMTKLMGATIDGTTASLPSESFQLVSLATTGNVQANQICQDRIYNGSWQGDIAEILIYNRPLSGSEEFAIGSYLTNKYGLVTSYPLQAMPYPPTVLSAAAVGSGAISLNWTPVLGATSYNVSTRNTLTSEATVITSSSLPQCVVSDLTAGTPYEFKVSAIFANGSSSAYSAPVMATPAATTAYVSWAAHSDQGLTSENNGPMDDPDADGIANLMEYALGGAPMESSRSVLPVLRKIGGRWFLEYSSSDLSLATTTQVVEYSHNLLQWNSITIPSSGVVITQGRVTVAIPTVVGKPTFARLVVRQ